MFQKVYWAAYSSYCGNYCYSHDSRSNRGGTDQTMQTTTFTQQWHQSADSAWGSQTHIDQKINGQLIDLENTVLLGDKVQNFKLQIHLQCD